MQAWEGMSPLLGSGWFEAVLMNVMGPLLPLSKGMLIIFSSLIMWLMRARLR